MTNGTISLASTAGLTLVSGANGSSAFTYSGTVSALNTALNSGVTFNPTNAYRGLAQITVTTNDLGNSGSGGALSDTDTIKVHVGALVVTNINDVNNGDASSIANLVASDGGDGISLREAILAANATLNVGGPDYIYFNIAGAGPHIINLSSALPAITSPVIIGASSEPDFGGTPVLVLNGGGTIADGIQLYGGSGGSTIRGLVIQNFTQDGIDISESNGNTIVGNWIGLNSTGTSAASNRHGINIWNSNNTIIGGSTPADRNVVSGNTNIGININTDNATSTGNQIRGNFIGTDYTGMSAVGNQNAGIYITSANNVIGGTSANQGNVISSTISAHGVSLGVAANNTLIAGNLIGLNATGTAALGNAGSGISVQSANNTIGGITAQARNVISGNGFVGIGLIGSSATGNTVVGNYIGLNAAGNGMIGNSNDGVYLIDGASNNTIGGATSAHRNVIAGNSDGVQIGGLDGGSNNNIVQGNYIGTDATGTLDFGNNDDGVDIDNAALNNQVIGNLISGNTGDGIDLGDAGASTGTIIRGNLIGTRANGTTALGNSGHGILIGNGGTANNTLIGGTTTGQGNIIAFNSGDGIYVAASTGVSILGNSIHSNTGLGIDLGANNVTLNDIGDTDSGANALMNFFPLSIMCRS